MLGTLRKKSAVSSDIQDLTVKTFLSKQDKKIPNRFLVMFFMFMVP